MARGAFYATMGLVAGATWEELGTPLIWLLATIVTWGVTLIVTLPVMLLLSIPVQKILRLIHRRRPGRWYLPLAVLAALPFIVLLFAVCWALFGLPTLPWKLSAILPLARTILGAAIGLGLGCARDIRPPLTGAQP